MGLLGKPWMYINEGNVHIVLQVVGTEFVVRLIKEDEKPMDLESVRNSVNFVNFVMIPLVSNDDCDLQEIVELSGTELEELERHLLQFRPEQRRFKSVLSSYAIKVSNLTILSPKCLTNYCIEIKPKEGFISSKFLKYSKCYYCLKQYLKLKESQIDKVSKYCPLDLFSEDRIRMKNALMNLVSNPQNNFKLFKNGNIIYSDKTCTSNFDDIIKDIIVFGNSSELFLDFLIEILLGDSSCSNKILKESKEITVSTEKPQCYEASRLDNNSFLQKLLRLQKISDGLNFDITDKGEGIDYVSSILNLLKMNNFNLNIKDDQEKLLTTISPKSLALISAVAKDCSIMISFSPNFEEGVSTIQIGESIIPYKIAATDLEPKSAKTLAKRHKTEKKLLDIYGQHLESLKNDTQCKYNMIQPHTETRAKQLEAWQQLISEYMKSTKQSTIDIRESQNSPLFNNASINRKLSQDAILTVLEEMARCGKAAAVDKSKNVWEVYWHSLDEWGNMVYSWACSSGLNNTVCTLFELREGENTVDEEFHGIDMNILIKALKSLEARGRCELMEFDENQGVKFF